MNLLLVLAILAVTPFVLTFLIYLTQPWRKNPAGRAIMLLVFVATLALSTSVWRVVADTAPPHWYRLAVFIAVAVAGWYLLGTVVYLIATGGRRRAPADQQLTR